MTKYGFHGEDDVLRRHLLIVAQIPDARRDGLEERVERPIVPTDGVGEGPNQIRRLGGVERKRWNDDCLGTGHADSLETSDRAASSAFASFLRGTGVDRRRFRSMPAADHKRKDCSDFQPGVRG